jgi:hypothetical protein
MGVIMVGHMLVNHMPTTNPVDNTREFQSYGHFHCLILICHTYEHEDC